MKAANSAPCRGSVWFTLVKLVRHNLLKLSCHWNDYSGMRTISRISAVFLLLFTCKLSLAQHSHGILTPGVTFPQDDSVLIDPPKMVTMSFRVDVRLLKLALYTADEQWIDIGFQYDPSRMNNNFVLPIPFELPASEYYIARWSVTDDVRGLVNGEFKFAFGPGAIPPSEAIETRVSEREEVLPSTGSYRLETLQ